jgi:hypothetical protein
MADDLTTSVPDSGNIARAKNPSGRLWFEVDAIA